MGAIWGSVSCPQELQHATEDASQSPPKALYECNLFKDWFSNPAANKAVSPNQSMSSVHISSSKGPIQYLLNVEDPSPEVEGEDSL